MKNKTLISEIRKFQKIAGILKETLGETGKPLFRVGDEVSYRYEGEPLEFGHVVDLARNWEEVIKKGGDNLDVWTDFWNDEESWTDYGYNSYEEWEKNGVAPLKNSPWYKVEGDEMEQGGGWFPAEYVDNV